MREFVIKRDGLVCRRTGLVLIGKHPAPNSPVADHITPHRGDPALFWNPDNVQLIAKYIHDGDKQREEQAIPQGVWY